MISDRELRLRQRIDQVTDERDLARELLAEARARARRWSVLAYERGRRAEMWKTRWKADRG